MRVAHTHVANVLIIMRNRIGRKPSRILLDKNRKRSRFEGLNVGKSKQGTKEPLCYTELFTERKA